MADGDSLAMAMGCIEADLYQANLRASRTLAPELSERTKLCLAFLHKVARIEVVGTATNASGNNTFVVNVMINDGTNESDAAALDVAKLKSGVTTASFQIQRTLREFKELEHIVKHWSKKYPRHGFTPCPYCYVLEHVDLPGGLARTVMSTGRLQYKLQELLNTYVSKARLPRPSEFECQGFDHIPSVVTRFLTKDLPRSDANAADNEEAEANDAVPMATAIVATAVASVGDLAEEKQ